MSEFERQDSHKKKSMPDSWNSSEGKHSNVRLERKGARQKPKIGFRNEKKKRGKHPSGYEEVMVHNPTEVEKIEDGEAARIASSVGGRKRIEIIEKANENDVHVLNSGESS